MPIDLRSRDALTDAALRRAFDSSGDCIKVLDLSGHLLVMNEGGAEKMCLRSADELLGQDWIGFWTGEDRALARQALEDAKAGLIGRCQGYLPTAHGHPKWWDSVVTSINGEDGVPGGLLVISRDITEIHELECALKVANARNDALIWATSEIVWRTDATQITGDGKGWSEFTGQSDESAAAGRMVGLCPPRRPGKRRSDPQQGRSATGLPMSTNTAFIITAANGDGW